MSDNIMNTGSFKNGDIVWAKWSNIQWPGYYRDIDKIKDDDIVIAPRYIAAIEFFKEEEYEYITAKGLNLVHQYNCPKKNEFILKGVQKQRQMKSGQMDKFLEDVIHAEKLTGGNENILDLPEFAKKEKVKRNYIGLSETNRKPQKHPATSTPTKSDDGTTSAKKRKISSEFASNEFSLMSPELASSFSSTDSTKPDAVASSSTTEGEPPASRCPEITDSNQDSGSDYDSDALNTSSNLRDSEFQKDQIVWVPHRKVHYLAFVTHVNNSKKRRLSLRWVNSNRISSSFTKPEKGVLDFCDEKRNKSLLDAALKVDYEQRKAYDRCVQFLASNCNPEKTLSAFRFLTYHPLDLHYGALSDKMVESYLGKDVQIEDPEIHRSEDESEEEVNEGESAGEEEKTEKLPSSQALQDKQFSPAQVVWMKAEGKKLLAVIRSRECQMHLSAIQRKRKKNSRHDAFTVGSVRDQMALNLRSGFGLFYNLNQALELKNILEKYLSVEFKTHRQKYISNVFIPEAILFGMRKLYGLSEEAAEERYQTFSSPIAFNEYLTSIGISGDVERRNGLVEEAIQEAEESAIINESIGNSISTVVDKDMSVEDKVALMFGENDTTTAEDLDMSVEDKVALMFGENDTKTDEDKIMTVEDELAQIVGEKDATIESTKVNRQSGENDNHAFEDKNMTVEDKVAQIFGENNTMAFEDKIMTVEDKVAAIVGENDTSTVEDKTMTVEDNVALIFGENNTSASTVEHKIMSVER